jgi:hypothetical protein
MTARLFLILFIFFILVFKGEAQTNPFSYLNTNEISKLEEFQEWYYTFIGRYQKALEERDKSMRQKKTLFKKDSLSFLEWVPLSAKIYILNEAKKHKFVLINEAHHDPRHRVFVTSLLEGLFAQGFTHFGIETLSHTDSLLNKRGYPYISSGEYLIEPQFGNLVREAQKIGFIIFPYESTEKLDIDSKKSVPEKIIAKMDFRDSIQAKNIMHVVEKNPDSKFLIFAGFGHIAERKKSGWTTMATNIKNWTGLDPLTIDQTNMTEHNNEKYNDKYFRVSKVTKPSVLLKNEKPFVRPPRKGMYDMHIFHPRANYKFNRPDWIYNTKKTRFIHVKKKHLKKVSFPCLVKAYLCKEKLEKTIPFDVIQLDSIEDNTSLLLPKGKYKIIITSDSGQKLYKLKVK